MYDAIYEDLEDDDWDDDEPDDYQDCPHCGSEEFYDDGSSNLCCGSCGAVFEGEGAQVQLDD